MCLVQDTLIIDSSESSESSIDTNESSSESEEDTVSSCTVDVYTMC